MIDVQRPSLDELSAMTHSKKDALILHLFDVLETLEKREMHSDDVSNGADRRKFSRIKVPVVNSSFCEIALPLPKEDSSEEYKRHYATAIDKIKRNHNHYGHCTTAINLIHFRLFDISMAGCSILNHDEEFSYFLTTHKIYENCRILTPDRGEIAISFEVMTNRKIECFDAHKFNELIGIKFLEVNHRNSNRNPKASATHSNQVLSTLEYEIINN